MSMEEKQNSQTFQDFNQNIFRPKTREEISEIIKEESSLKRLKPLFLSIGLKEGFSVAAKENYGFFNLLIKNEVNGLVH